MNLTRSSQRVTAFFLLIILGWNFFLSVFWPQWRLSLVWHEHIIIGPLYPGWEDHHGHRHSPDGSEIPSAAQFVYHNGGSGVSTKIISLYQSVVGDGTILSLGIQLLWLTEGPILPEFSSIARPLGMASLVLSSAFLSPPDRPPSASLQ